jgi:hypothetical protein
MPEAEVRARLAAMPRSRRMTHAEFSLIRCARRFPKSRK